MSPAPGARAEPEASPYVSRGGIKLAHALEVFGVEAAGRRALDAGAAHGGFTDCLLRRGAARVIAVDVAYGDFDWRLRNDPRVRVVERTNIRQLELASLGEEPVDLAVADLSFISLVTVRDALVAACRPDAEFVLLVKPQFEAPKGGVARGGVVRDAAMWREAMVRVAQAYREADFGIAAATCSPIAGRAGNREFFLHCRRGAADAGDAAIHRAVSEGT